MKQFTGRAGALLLLALLAAVAATAVIAPRLERPEAAQERAIRSAYADIDAALNVLDVERALSHYSPDYRGPVIGAVVGSRAQLQQTWKMWASLPTPMRFESSVEQVRVSGQIADVRVLRRSAMALETGAASPVRQRSEMTAQERWEWSGGKWLLRSSRPLSFTMDGKPYPNPSPFAEPGS